MTLPLATRVDKLVSLYQQEIAWHTDELEDNLAPLGKSYHQERIDECKKQIEELYARLLERNTDHQAKCPHCGLWSTVRYCGTMKVWAWLYYGEYCPNCGEWCDLSDAPRRKVIRD